MQAVVTKTSTFLEAKLMHPPMSTADEVAEWMAKEVRATGKLIQKEAAATIADGFGGGHVYPNPKGNLAISRAVLDAFRDRTKDDVLWIRGRRFWRLREEADGPGRLHNP